MSTRRGRPPKYGTPSKFVAVTLPEAVVAELAAMHDDLGWAIVQLVERQRSAPPSRRAGKIKAARPVPPDIRRGSGHAVAAAELVSVGAGQSLIVVNSAAVRAIPGVQMIPLSETEAFLALEPGRGMSDLEIAVLDHVERLRAHPRDRAAVALLLNKLRRWRRDANLAFHSRAILLVERRKKKGAEV